MEEQNQAVEDVVVGETYAMFESASPDDVARLPEADGYCGVEFRDEGLEFTWSDLPNEVSIDSNGGSLL